MFITRVETPSPDLIAGAIRSKGARLTVEKANRIADRAVAIAEDLAERELTFRRPQRRGERKGAIHYSRAFAARKASGIGFPVETAVMNRSDIAHIIEKGSQPHTIQGNPLLALPGRAGDPGLPSTFGRRKGNTVVKVVNHPGTRPHKIVERATLQALREAGIRVNARA